MNKTITDSQFYMWRTLFAVAHADNVLDDGEIEYMAKVLEEIDFSDEQTKILKDDIANPKDVEEMFDGVDDVQDRMHFFDIARELVWADGDFCEEEQSAIIRLARKHFQITDIDSLVGKINLELEEDGKSPDDDDAYHYSKDGVKRSNFGSSLNSFKKRFLEVITGKQ